MTDKRSAPSAWQIGKVLEIVREMRERQQSDYIPTDDVDAWIIRDEHEIDPEDVLRRLVRASLEADSMDEAIERRIDDLRIRQERYVKRREEYRTSISLVMGALDIAKFTSPDAAVSLRPNKGGALLIADGSVPPPEYEREVAPQWDKAKVKADLQAGVIVEGATLSQGGPPILTLKAR